MVGVIVYSVAATTVTFAYMVANEIFKWEDRFAGAVTATCLGALCVFTFPVSVICFVAYVLSIAAKKVAELIRAIRR